MKKILEEQYKNDKFVGATSSRPFFEEIAKYNKGITLIALIITIIVMLILVGVSVNVAINGGIFSKTKEASTKTEIEYIRERVESVRKELEIDKLASSDPSVTTEKFRDRLLEEFAVKETDTNNEDTIIELDNPYAILVYSDLNFEVVEKSKIYLTAKEAEEIWEIDETGTLKDYQGTDSEIIIPIKIGEKDVKTIDTYSIGFWGGDWQIEKVIIPEGVTSIGNKAFYGCTKLTDITIPNSVKIIGEGAFELCGNLTNITIPDGLTSIGRGAFRQCESLTNITIPNTIKVIENSTFLFCKGLANVTLPNGIETIGESAFNGCEKLANINIPNSVKTIGKFAFADCLGLTNIRIPEGITLINKQTFWRCRNLTNITIPNSVTSIADDAFGYCNQLETIYFAEGNNKIPDGQPWGAPSTVQVIKLGQD